jgi:hypothetical protein
MNSQHFEFKVKPWKERRMFQFILSSLILLASMVIPGVTQMSFGQSNDECGTLPIRSVTVSSYDLSSPPSHAVDNNMDTKWSNNGADSWISFNLGSSKIICSADISWYRGNLRQVSFVVSTSSDGYSYKSVYSGKTSGVTPYFERYEFGDVNANYLKITVKGNTENNWASITEVGISGYGGSVDASGRSTTSYNNDQDSVRTSSDNSAPTLSIQTLDAQTSTNPKYVYEPYLELTGENEYQEVISGSSLQPTIFSVGAWFNTASSYSSNSFIVNKGGQGSEAAGKNMNFGIWMTSLEKIQGGFETKDGTNYYATSSNAYNDGIWHYAVATYDGRNVRLYVDGAQVASKTAYNKVPDNTGMQPLRIGANSLTLNGYFTGSVDEIRVWNGRALTSSEVASAYNNGIFNSNGQVVYLSFSSLETIPPTIISKSPDGGAAGVTTDTVVDIVFSEDMRSSSVNPKTIQLKEVSTNTILPTTVNEAAGSVVMDPTADLEYATKYEVRVIGGSSGVKDLAGNPLANDAVWSFTTIASSSDPFGVKKIYPTKSGGDQWYMNMDGPTSDGRFNPQATITKNLDGSWKMLSTTKVRMDVWTTGSSPVHPNKGGMDTYYIPTIENRGYWYRADDWKDVEMTGYFRLNNNAQEEFTYYTRSVQHTDNHNGCGGGSYKLDLGFDGTVYFNKEEWHVSYVGGQPRVSKDVGLGPIQGKWVGFKGIMYNIIEDGKISVKLEIWLDRDNDNTWTKAHEYTDTGDWGTDGGHCGGAPDQLITWGSPYATYRWDEVTDVDFKNLSVREIYVP